jgi:hypothetical protein
MVFKDVILCLVRVTSILEEHSAFRIEEMTQVFLKTGSYVPVYNIHNIHHCENPKYHKSTEVCEILYLQCESLNQILSKQHNFSGHPL